MSFKIVSENTVVEVDGKRLTSRQGFHEEFARVFGFPEFYGANMDAWIDCMGYLDDPKAGMTNVVVAKGKVATIWVKNYEFFKQNASGTWHDLIECTAFVNFRAVEQGDDPLLALAFHD